MACNYWLQIFSGIRACEVPSLASSELVQQGGEMEQYTKNIMIAVDSERVVGVGVHEVTQLQ